MVRRIRSTRLPPRLCQTQLESTLIGARTFFRGFGLHLLLQNGDWLVQ